MSTLNPGFRERLLQNCFDQYEGNFRNGDPANNKLDFEKIKSNWPLRHEVIRHLGRSVLLHNPKFVVGVPDGGTWIAEDLARKLDIVHIELSKHNVSKDIVGFASAHNRVNCLRLDRGVLVEDVLRTLTSTAGVLNMPEMKGRIVAVEAIWDRGDPVSRQKIAVGQNALIVEHIPAQLAPNSDLWQYASVQESTIRQGN